MPASPDLRIDSLALRPLQREEFAQIPRFFLESGYPVPVVPIQAWGAWDGTSLVAALALCREDDAWVLRGPEIAFKYRRLGIGGALLRLAEPAFADRIVHCIAYSFLLRLYGSIGFVACPADETPKVLARTVNDLSALGWQLQVVRRLPR